MIFLSTAIITYFISRPGYITTNKDSLNNINDALEIIKEYKWGHGKDKTRFANKTLEIQTTEDNEKILNSIAKNLDDVFNKYTQRETLLHVDTLQLKTLKYFNDHH
jgi:hypothetical protein